MSITVMSARKPLSIESIMSHYPAIFANHKSSNCSERYNFISTERLINSMKSEGFYPYMISQAKSRSEERRSFTRHAICFRHESMFGDIEDEIVPQIVVMNAHDGTSCYKIYCGFFRFVCSNGLVVGNTLSALKVYHKGVQNTIDNVIDASFRVLDNSQNMLEVIDAWNGISLSQEQRLELAMKTHELKFGTKDTPIKPEQFLTVHNSKDYVDESTLWNTYNILQENLIKGGLVGWKDASRNKKREHLKVTTRAITNVQQNVAMNAELWNMAENMYNIVA